MKVTIVLEHDDSDNCLVHEASSIESAIQALSGFAKSTPAPATQRSAIAILITEQAVGHLAQQTGLDPETAESLLQELVTMIVLERTDPNAPPWWEEAGIDPNRTNPPGWMGDITGPGADLPDVP